MALSVGDLVGKKYRVLKHLGRGGLGDVYLAEDQLLARKVAIKHLRPGSTREQADVERFLAEARAIARIQHENVVAIYDAIEEKERNYYLVMEYADEGTVADLLRREGQLPVLRALEFAQAIAQALEVVHAQGILHGDIKPSNIVLVSSRGSVKAKLADFGLSQAITWAEADQAVFAGSILYSAPEQLCGYTMDCRADLYALGTVLYEMLAGEPPFPYTGKPEDVEHLIRSKLEGLPVPPSQLNPDVSPAVDALVLKVLSKAPDERYPDARALGQALHRAMETHQAWQERVQSAYAQGVEYEQRGEWLDAIACYEAVLAEQPVHAESQKRLARAKENLDWGARYEEGLRAYDWGEWTEAEKILSQVVTHDTSYADGEAAVRLQEARRQSELARLHNEARGCEAEERWSEAVSLYLKILTEVSDYKDVSARLANAIEQQKRQTLYNKAREHLANQDWTEAVKTLQELERLKPGYKDSAALLVKARRQKRLDELYTQATQALNGGEWASAVEAFGQLVQLEPEYRDAATKRAIAERQERLGSLYEQAMTDTVAEDWTAAAARLQEIREIAPSYQDVDRLLEETLQKQHIADLYQEGMQLYGEEEWEQAIQRLEQVHQLQPDYRDVGHRLEEARRVQRIQALYAQARQFEVEERWTEAIRTYSDIIQQNPNHRDAKAGLARVSAASLGRGHPLAVERRERIVAVVASLLVIIALSCMFLEPLSRIASAILPSPTPGLALLSPVVLEAPEDGSSLAFGSEVMLSWSYPYTLKANERYRLELQPVGQAASILYCADDYYRLPTPSLGEYHWAVSVVRSIAQDQYVLASEESQWHGFKIASLSPVAHHISPASTLKGVSASVAISGENLTRPLTLTIGVPLRVTYVDSSTITATVPTTLGAGEYPVIIKDSTGNGISFASFRVDDPLSPTPSVPATPARYAPPQLTGVGVLGRNVTFQWDWPRTLAEDEWFAVRVGRLPDMPHSQYWGKEREYTLSMYTLGGQQGEYNWEVAICRGKPETATCEQLAVSERGVFSFAGSSATPEP